MNKKITIKDDAWEFEMDGDDSRLSDQERHELGININRMMNELTTVIKVGEYLEQGLWVGEGWEEIASWSIEVECEEILLQLRQGVKYDI